MKQEHKSIGIGVITICFALAITLLWRYSPPPPDTSHHTETFPATAVGWHRANATERGKIASAITVKSGQWKSLGVKPFDTMVRQELSRDFIVSDNKAIGSGKVIGPDSTNNMLYSVRISRFGDYTIESY